MKIIKAYVELPRNSIFKIYVLRVSEIILFYSGTYSFFLSFLNLFSLIYNLIISTFVLNVMQLAKRSN